jgi:hypothetical protein
VGAAQASVSVRIGTVLALVLMPVNRKFYEVLTILCLDSSAAAATVLNL